MPTVIQCKVLLMIQEHIKEYQRPPTRREIALRFGWTFGNAVQCHLTALEKKGFLQRVHNTGRGLQVLRPIVRIHLGAIRGKRLVGNGVLIVDAWGKFVAQFSEESWCAKTK